MNILSHYALEMV